MKSTCLKQSAPRGEPEFRFQLLGHLGKPLRYSGFDTHQYKAQDFLIMCLNLSATKGYVVL